MTTDLSLPADQYLRMSPINSNSLDKQASAIEKYALNHGFVVVKTYCEAVRSGLHLKNRDGLKQLLLDVVQG